MAALLLSAACGGAARTPVEPRDPAVLRLASFDFPENRMLAELYGERLRRAGFRVEVLTGLGTREVVAPALRQGLVDLVIDYTGSLLDYSAAARRRRTGRPRRCGPRSPTGCPGAGCRCCGRRRPRTPTASRSGRRSPGTTA